MAITRTQYINDYSAKDDAGRAALHRAYYAQFVTSTVINYVRRFIGEKAIKASADPHMNDIPLAKWDHLDSLIRPIGARINKAINGQSVWSLSDTVCVAKEAARQIKEQN